jgi:hypothetical protein
MRKNKRRKASVSVKNIPRFRASALTIGVLRSTYYPDVQPSFRVDGFLTGASGLASIEPILKERWA